MDTVNPEEENFYVFNSLFVELMFASDNQCHLKNIAKNLVTRNRCWFIVNQSRIHWYGVCYQKPVHHEQAKLYVADSLYSKLSDYNSVLSSIKKFIYNFHDVNQTNCPAIFTHVLDVKKQANGSDCGVHTQFNIATVEKRSGDMIAENISLYLYPAIEVYEVLREEMFNLLRSRSNGLQHIQYKAQRKTQTPYITKKWVDQDRSLYKKIKIIEVVD